MSETNENIVNEVAPVADAAQNPDIQARLAQIQERMAARAQAVMSDTEEEQAEVEQEKQITGADVDWSDYDLDARFAHLYPRSVLKPTEEGPKWIVVMDDYYILRAPYSVLGARIADMVNGPERWQLQSAAVAGGAISKKQALLMGGRFHDSGACGIVTLQRKYLMALPTPNLLKTEAEDAPGAVTDEDLKKAEDDAANWIAREEAASTTEPNTAETIPVTPPALTERGETVESAPLDNLSPGSLAAGEEAAEAQ